MAKAPQNTEVDAYVFIKGNLRTLGWDTRNPARVAAGQVWTQNECLAHPEIKRCFGQDRPEAVVRVSETQLWILEAKRNHSQLAQAIKEAEEDYAKPLNDGGLLSTHLATGVAGNQLDSFLIRTAYYDGANWVPVTLNGVEVTGLLTPEQARQIITSGNPDLTLPQIDEKLFLSRANHINRILHLGAVNPHERAGVMAALLLSEIGDTQPNIEERNAQILIGDINNRVRAVLQRQRKMEFYEAQDLGIVLTPRHLTRWAADVLDIRSNDILYDPTCGTAGFLVAAFDYVKQRASSAQIDRFKQYGVFGVEQDACVAALAVVNMIFRGDGKNNIIEGNCFAQHLTAKQEGSIATASFTTSTPAAPPVTKVLMNPPFALQRSDDKEFRFIDQALAQMEHGGVLFSVLPYSAMVRPGVYHTWRRDALLPNHTLLGVVTFPPDLFYPVGVTSIGVFIRKGPPHPASQSVLWARAITDGLQISKRKRLPSPRVGNDLERVRGDVRAFINNPQLPIQNIPQLQKAAPINFADSTLELVPEAYLDQRALTNEEIQRGIEDGVRSTFAYLVKINRAILLTLSHQPSYGEADHWKRYRITDLFELKRGNFHSIERLDPGPYPTISRIGTDNGFVGFFDKPENARVWPCKTITVSSVTGDAFVQWQVFGDGDRLARYGEGRPRPWSHGVLCGRCRLLAFGQSRF